MKTNFHNKNFALSLAFMMRFKATRKWTNSYCYYIRIRIISCLSVFCKLFTNQAFSLPCALFFTYLTFRHRSQISRIYVAASRVLRLYQVIITKQNPQNFDNFPFIWQQFDMTCHFSPYFVSMVTRMTVTIF